MKVVPIQERLYGGICQKLMSADGRIRYYLIRSLAVIGDEERTVFSLLARGRGSCGFWFDFAPCDRALRLLRALAEGSVAPDALDDLLDEM